jgi:molecular chaperone HscB
MNYFQLFELPMQWRVDKKNLTQKYFELSRKCHPDYFATASEDEQAVALEKSAMLNKALKVLQQPIETIKYVLQLKDVLVEDEKYELPANFLMAMMDIQEQLAEAQLHADNKAIENIWKEIEALERSIEAPVQLLLKNYNESHLTPANFLAVKTYYYKKKYLQRIVNQLKLKP